MAFVYGLIAADKITITFSLCIKAFCPAAAEIGTKIYIYNLVLG